MKYSEAKIGRIFLLRLEDGEILHETIEAFASEHEIRAAALTVLGGADEGSDLQTLERELVGVDHAEVGAWILEAWSLPPGIIEAVRGHHGDTTQPGVPGVLALTDRLIGLTDLGSGTVRREAEALLDTGSLTLAGWHDVLQQLRDGGEIAALTALD